MPTDITFIGLGRMGSALARCFLRSGKSLTVFNRSPDKTAAFEGDATIAPSAAQACSQSPLTVMCVSDYASAQSILDDVDVIAALQGRTLVQMSSGSPEDARRSEAWAEQHGIGYLEGAIIAYPAGVGTDGAIVMFSGDETLFEPHRKSLLVLGGRSRYIGRPVGAASTLDCALLEFMYASFAGMFHGAALCEAEGYPVDDFFASLVDMYPLVSGTALVSEPMIKDRAFGGDQASTAVHHAAIVNIQRASADKNTATELPDALVKMFGRPVARGRGLDEAAVVFEDQLKPTT